MARIGETRCLNPKCTCADVAVQKTAANTLTLNCHKCSFSAFAKPGTKFRRDLESPGVIRLDDDQAPAAAPEPAHPQQTAGPVREVKKPSGYYIGS